MLGSNNHDIEEINLLTKKFFSLFTNKNGVKPNLDGIFTLCLPKAIIIKNTGSIPEIYSLEQFIDPRKTILTDGTLTDFSEYEISEHTDIYKKIAHRFCSYKKSGIMNNVHFEVKGMKTIQFIKTDLGWKISSVAWDDE